MARRLLYFALGLGAALLVVAAVLSPRHIRSLVRLKPTPAPTSSAPPVAQLEMAPEPGAPPPAVETLPTPVPSSEPAPTPQPPPEKPAGSSTLVLETTEEDGPALGVRFTGNPEREKKEATVASHDALRAFQGNYEGEVRWNHRPAGAWRMSWELVSRDGPAGAQGRFRVELRRQGRVPAGREATGSLDLLKRAKNGDALLVDASPGWLLKVVPTPPRRGLSGTIYLRRDKRLGPAGTFSLRAR